MIVRCRECKEERLTSEELLRDEGGKCPCGSFRLEVVDRFSEEPDDAWHGRYEALAGA